ncbi:RDD family protein [uncultured Roseivirga sp.]|uniref:RDD family protein n=1 Tax=uncultured Roseivirga sp. TaxID=543088 RepID=UPI0030DA2C77|tara:strand:+ start:2915 stop:3334 length:420 start_codon:yes stop_codon:yes gene_type:complete
MEYPKTSFRIKAAIVDAILILTVMIITAFAIDSIGGVPDWVRIMIMALLFIAYEPMMVATNGGTIGHRILGVEVRKSSDSTQRLSLPIAIVRSILKFVLGIFSVLVSYTREDNRCIHDLICDSVVVYRKSARITSPSPS